MHIPDLVRHIWREQGLYESPKSAMQAFLIAFDEQPYACEEHIKAFRENYYELFNEVVPPLLKDPDKLLRLILIRHAHVDQPDEIKLLKEFIKTSVPVQDEAELLEIVNLGHKGLLKELNQREDLTSELRRALYTSKSAPAAMSLVAPSPAKKPATKSTKRAKKSK